MARTSAPRRAALAGLGVVLAVASVEGLLRLAALAYSPYRRNALDSADPGARRILCVGDSFTWGSGAPPGQSYPDHLQRLLGSRARVRNEGRPGANSSEVAESIDALLAEWHPHVVLLLVGNNEYSLFKSSYYRFAGTRAERLREAAARALRGLRIYRVSWLGLRELRRRYRLARYRCPPEASRLSAEAIAAIDRARGLTRSGRAASAERKRALDEAADLLRRSLEIYPHQAKAWWALGELELARGRRAEANAFYQRGLEYDPDGRLGAFHLWDFQYGEVDENAIRSAFRRSLKTIRSACRRASARLVLQTYPYPALEDSPATAYLGEIRDFADSEGLLLIDHTRAPDFRDDRRQVDGHPSPRREYFAPDGHLNGEGYAVMARAIATALRRERLLGE